jgi:leader peptidase (prepilin peptidase)/N-methyltransferase
MIPELALVVLAGIYGAMLGSFLNVCVYRLPRDESVIRPRSRCPGCGAPIAWYDNLPVLSWLALRGKCRRCGTRISIQYPLVELAVGLVWALAVWRWSVTVAAVSAGVFVSLLIGILLTDARHMIIPDEFSLGGLGAGLALAALPGGMPLWTAVAGAALGYGLLWAVGLAGKWWAGRDAMGGGDLKMMAMVGAFLGWRGVLMTVFLGSVAGTVVYLPALLRRERHKEVPFGVYLAAGAMASLLFGERLIRWYTAFVFGGGAGA